jgi:hypothetical protein
MYITRPDMHCNALLVPRAGGELTHQKSRGNSGGPRLTHSITRA